MENSLAPEFIDPPRLVDMDEAQQRDFIEAIRMRRLVAVHYHEEVQAAREANKRAILDGKYERLEKKLQSSLTKIDGEIQKMQDAFSKLNVLKLESM